MHELVTWAVCSIISILGDSCALTSFACFKSVVESFLFKFDPFSTIFCSIGDGSTPDKIRPGGGGWG